MAQFEKIRAASEQHARSRDSIIIQLLKLLLGLWSNFDRWDDVDTVAGMAARSASLVDAATGRARLANRSYITSVLRELEVMPDSLPPLVNAYPRSNVGASDVYMRPVDQFIWRRRNGGTIEESQAAFEERLIEIAESDLAAADRDEAQRLYNAVQEVTAYRRIIHPELSKSGTCGLCIVASAQVYSTDELMPLHGGSCNCDTLPITIGNDPGFRLNDDDLKTIYAAAGSTAADDLVNTRVTINEHGELGPVLVKKGDHFKTAEEAGRPAYVKPTPESIRRDRTAERDGLVAKLASAQTRYDTMPSEVKFDRGGNTTPEAVALFRSIKYMRERVTQIDSFLSRLAA